MLRAKIRNQVNDKKGNDYNSFQNHIKNYKERGDMLVEAWSRKPVGVRLDRTYAKDPDKARRIAMSLQQEAKYLKKLKEEGTQIKSALTTRPENVLRIVRIGVGQSNRANIGHEWILTTPDDAFYFVDTKYGSTKRDATMGSLVYENMTGDYPSEYNRTVIGNTTNSLTYNGVLTPNPIVPLTVAVTVGGKKVTNDDGNGNLLSNSTISNGTINYQTGNFSITFVTLPEPGLEIVVFFNFDSEKAENYDEWGSIELFLRRDRFNARPHPLTYQFSKMFDLVLSTTGVGDADEMLIKRVGDTHAMAKDSKFFERARMLALTNPITEFDASFTNAGSDNLYNHAQTILQTIQKVDGNLYDDIKRGELNKFVVGTQALAFLKMHKLWQSDDSQRRVGGSYLAGTLDGKEVYVAPDSQNGIRKDEILATYKNPDEDGDVNIAIGVLTELYAVLDYPELYRKGTLARVEDMRDINPKFFRLIKLNNL